MTDKLKELKHLAKALMPHQRRDMNFPASFNTVIEILCKLLHKKENPKLLSPDGVLISIKRNEQQRVAGHLA
jgi:hypothetical protein